MIIEWLQSIIRDKYKNIDGYSPTLSLINFSRLSTPRREIISLGVIIGYLSLSFFISVSLPLSLFIGPSIHAFLHPCDLCNMKYFFKISPIFYTSCQHDLNRQGCMVACILISFLYIKSWIKTALIVIQYSTYFFLYTMEYHWILPHPGAAKVNIHSATPFIPFQNGNINGLGPIIQNSEGEFFKISNGILPASSFI